MTLKTMMKAVGPVLLVCLATGPALAQPPTPAGLTPCVFAHDEILSNLGLDIDTTQVADMTLRGGRDVGCLYTIKGSETVLTVRQTWDPAAPGRPAKVGGTGLRPVPGDRDGAAAGIGPPDEPSAELVYWRGPVKTRLLVHGPTLDANDMQARLLKLRRVP
jgi:hypothetical protein